MDRTVAFAQALERAKDRLILVIDGVPAAFGDIVQVDLVVRDANGGQVRVVSIDCPLFASFPQGSPN